MLTRADFIAFYPQFAAFTPASVMDSFLAQANVRFDDFGVDAEEARRLYVAHKLTMYARTALPEGAEASMGLLVSSGETQQTIAEKKVGEVSIKYATSSASQAAAGGSASTGFADLPETTYGLQLLSLLRLYRQSYYVR